MLHRTLGALALLLTTACSAQAPDAAQHNAAAPATQSAAPAAASPATQAPAAGSPAPTAPAPQQQRPATGPTTHDGNYRAGVDYVPIDPPQPLQPGGDAIEVVEVFGYSCIHCANLQPLVNAWTATLPQDVAFHYVPAVFGGVWEAYARAYYTAETMGVLERSHDALFNALHVERRPFRSMEDIAGFYTDFGVDKAQFLATMNSFAVDAKIARAAQMTPRWGVEATPTMIVAGKYRVLTPREGGFKKMLDIVDFLIAKERAARAGA